MEFLSFARLWSLDCLSKQYFPIFPTQSIRTMLNLEKVKARKSFHPSASIDLGASYPNNVLLRWRVREVHNQFGISYFAGSQEVWEIKMWKHSFVCASNHILVFEEGRSYYLIIRQKARNIWSVLYSTFGCSGL